MSTPPSPTTSEATSTQIASDISGALDQHIVLIGLMGAGKTSIGRRIAQQLNIEFVDTDDEIIKAARMSINDIFETRGEQEFRRGEREVIKRLIQNRKKTVLAFGGGAFNDKSTRKLTLSNALVVWLNVDIDILVKRVSRRSHRPLLVDKDTKTTLQSLFDQRKSFYQEAHIEIATPNRTINSMIKITLDAIHKKLLSN